MNINPRNNSFMANIADPTVEALLGLWDDPTQHTSIEISTDHPLCGFVIVVEPPDSPRLIMPKITLVVGAA